MIPQWIYGLLHFLWKSVVALWIECGLTVDSVGKEIRPKLRNYFKKFANSSNQRIIFAQKLR